MTCLDYFGTGELHLPRLQNVCRGRIQSPEKGPWVEKEQGRRSGPPWQRAWGREAQRGILAPAALERSSGTDRRKRGAGEGVLAGCRVRPGAGTFREELFWGFSQTRRPGLRSHRSQEARSAVSPSSPHGTHAHTQGAPPLRPYRGAQAPRRAREPALPRADGAAAREAREPRRCGGRCSKVRRRLRPHHGWQPRPSASRSPGRPGPPPPPAPRLPARAAALRVPSSAHFEANMKETRGDRSAPFCTRLNHSYPGMWAPEHSAEARGNLTRASETGEDCRSVSVVFPITMLITGFVGNALAMLLVSRSYRRRESKRKKSFLLCIGWLALTDLVGQLLTSPVVIVVYLSKQRWEHLDPSGRLCTFFGLTMTVFGLSSLFIASAMAVERALAIRAPHWYASHMKTRATRSVLLGVWLAVLAFALLPVLNVGQYTVQWPGTWCFISTGERGNGTSSSHKWGNLFFASTFAFLGLSALTITFACNLATIKALVSRCRAKASASQSSAQWGRITTETAIQLLGIMCVLSICWSPLLVGSSRVFRGLGGAPVGIGHFSE